MPNIVTLLQDRSVSQHSKIAYYFLDEGEDGSHLITYSELHEKALAIAASLQEKHLYSKRVLLLYPAGLDFIAAFMGCLYAGVIAIPMLAPRPTEIENARGLIDSIAEDADIACILTTEIYVSQLKAHTVFATDTTAFTKKSSGTYQLPEIHDDTIAYLQYTSGSTSTPKGVITRHGNLNHSLKHTIKAWHYSKQSVTLTWAPHSHVYGLVCGLLVPLYHGTTSIVMSPEAFVQRPSRWLKAITKYQVTHSGGPNFGYDLCVRDVSEPELEGLDLSGWKVAINGGENVRHETLEEFNRKFVDAGFNPKHFCPAYGMSELTGAIAVNQYNSIPRVFNLATENLKDNKIHQVDGQTPHRAFVSNGSLLTGIHAAIVNPETLLPVADNEVGEVWLAGKSLTSGYWQREEESKAVFDARLAGSNRVYFRTGDLGFMMEDEICLTGRLKDLIVLHGKKYYPSDLEIAVTKELKKYSVGQYNTVFSTSINDRDQVIFIQEITQKMTDPEQNNIIEAIRDAVNKQYQIDLYGVILVKEKSLPRTPSGKLKRKLCQLQFEEDKLAIVKKQFKSKKAVTSETSNGTMVHASFIKLVASVLNRDVSEIDLTQPLSLYGFDSISLIKLASVLNDTYQMGITPAVLFEYSTLGEFFDKHSTAIDSFIETTHEYKKNSHTNDIAIIGISGIFPDAPDLETFWNNMIEGKNTIREIPEERWDWKEYYGDSLQDESKTKIKWGGFVNHIAHFDAHFFNISPREAELIDPQQRLFLQIAWHAIEDAGYSTNKLSQLKTGLFVGAFTNDYAELLQKNHITDPYITTGLTHSILANRVSYLLNLHGPSEAIDTACSSSLVAIHHAVLAIQNGDCDIAIAGGVNALLSPTSYLAAGKAGMLSEDGSCKTFDKKANGYVRGEGTAAILLKSFDRAQADGDHIYGVIKGTAVNHGGHVSSITVPNPVAQADVITSACNRAQIPVESISYIEAHGTGTSLGDPIEINGLKKAFSMLESNDSHINPGKNYCGVGSVKTHIGHLEAAAGIAGVIKVLLSMQNEKIPGNLHFDELNPYIELDGSPFYIVDKTKKWSRLKDTSKNEIPLRAGVSSFGFGGTNAHIILEEHAASVVENNTLKQHSHLITLSAKTKEALIQRIDDLRDWLIKQNTKPSIASLSYTLNAGRNHFPKRCMMVVNSVEQLQTFLTDNTSINFSENTDGVDKSAIAASVEQLLNNINDESMLSALGKLYIQGADINWDKLYVSKGIRISLPVYPFAKDNYWIPSKQNTVREEVLSTPASTGNYLSHIQNDIIKFVSDIIKVSPAKINVTTSLSDQGFDSISFGELAVDLEKYYKIELKPTVFYSYNSIHDLSEHFWSIYPSEIAKIYNHVAETVVVKSKPAATNPTPVVSAYIKPAASEAIAIIGMQGIFPQSKNINEFWDHLLAGDDLVTEIPAERWDWRDNYAGTKSEHDKTNSRWGGFIPDVDKFDASFFNISTREANLIDPQQRLMLETVWKTIEDAGYDPFSLSGQDAGLFFGMGFCDYQALISRQHKIFHGHLATGNSYALLANRISYFLNLHGPSEVIDTACSSSLVAINRAVNALRSGECSIAIAGGASVILNPDIYVITSQLGALSPDGRCKTFDKSANGFVKGEGIATILLKPLTQAQKDGDHIYAIIRGSAVNHGGKAQSLTAPNPEAQSQLLIKAYTQAGINPETISYIEAHGTGTPLGDPIEVEGLKKTFNKLSTNKDLQHHCGLGSVKSNIGHLEPASGIAGVIKVLLSMQHGKIPGNLHITDVNPLIDLSNSPFYLIDKTQPWNRLKDASGNEMPLRAGISSFGFGGTNAHVVLEELISASASANSRSQLKPYYLLTFSARQEESLKQKIVDLHDWLTLHSSSTDLESLCFTHNIGRAHFDYRCAVVVDSLNELQVTLNALMNNHQVANCVIHAAPASNIYEPLFEEICRSSLETIKNYNNVTPQIYKEKLLLLGDLYTRHFKFDFNTIHADEKKQRIGGLPSYPFDKQRYWFDAELQNQNAQIETINTDEIRDLTTFTLHYLQNIFAEKLKISPQQITVDATYEVYGVDSLLGLEITKRLEDDFGTLRKTLLYEKNRLIDLATELQQSYSEVILKLSSQSDHSVKRPVINLPAVNGKRNDHHVKSLVTEDIAIIGLTGIYPMAKNIDEFWDNLVNSKDCISDIPVERWNYKDYPVTVGGEEKYYNFGGFIPDVDKFDPLFFNIAPRDAALMDPQERLFMQSAWEVIEDAGYTRETLQRTADNSVGVFVGVTYNYYPLFIAEEWSKGNRLPLDLQLFSIANRVSYFLNVNGPSYVIDTACSSSLAAIHSACESIIRGECRMAIAGGINLSLHPSKYHMLGSYSFMSDKGQCASFAADGAGYVPSEGVGSVLLKPLSQAISDNDHIYGVIRSSSINHGGKTSGYTVPNPNAHAELIKKALSNANINPRTISYIEAHGTGTVLGDPIEVRGLQDAFAEYTHDKQFCAIGSVKSNIGHLEAAAGISQLTKVLMQMKHKKLVPSIHSKELNPYIDFAQTSFFVQRELTNWQPENGNIRRAGISSFGAGGTNVHVIVDEFIPSDTQMKQPVIHPFIFVLSALNSDRLQEYAHKMYAYFQAEKSKYSSENQINVWLTQACYTLQVGREQMSTRLAIKAHSYDALITKLKSYIDKPHEWQQDEINLADDYNNQLLQRISLPTYPFAKRRCWIPSQSVLPANQKTEIARKDHWLIFTDMESGFHLQDELGKSSCTYCFIGNEFTEITQNTFYINPSSVDDHTKVLDRLLAQKQINLKGIIYLWSLENENVAVNNFIEQRRLFDNLLITVVVRDVNNDKRPEILKNNNILYISLDKNYNLHDEAKFIAHEVRHFKPDENHIVYQNKIRRVMQLPRVTKSASPDREVVIELLLKILTRVLALDAGEIDIETPFLNYGLDSINGINFVAELNEYYPELISPMDLYRYPTVSQLTDYIVDASQSMTIQDSPLTSEFNDNEKQFLDDIAHLSDQEISKLLEKELMELDNVI